MFFLRFRAAVVAFFATIVGGTLGYRLIEGWSWLDSIWMVVITLTTIGFSEVQHLSDAGRVFTMLMIGAGVGITAYTAGQLTRYLIDGDLTRVLQQRRRKRIMERLHGHYVVIGLGGLGTEVTEDLIERGYAVVAIDHEHLPRAGLMDHNLPA